MHDAGRFDPRPVLGPPPLRGVIAAGPDKLHELSVGDLERVDAEAVHVNLVHGTLVIPRKRALVEVCAERGMPAGMRA